jgi:hypothetical protein
MLLPQQRLIESFAFTLTKPIGYVLNGAPSEEGSFRDLNLY